MADEPENLVLVLLRRMAEQIQGIDDRLKRLEGKVDLLTAKVGSLETQLSVLKMAYYQQATHADRTIDRLDGIERRLAKLEQA